MYNDLPVIAVANRRFLARVVSWVASQGIAQFVDVGCGMPTVPNAHESARAVIGDARLAYVDNDPVVLSHLEPAAATSGPGLTVVAGDVREVAMLLHFFDVPDAQDLVARYVAALAPGSCVVLTMGLVLGERGDTFFRAYMADGPTKLYQHDATDFASFLGPLELVEPGVGDGRTVRPGWAKAPVPPERDCAIIVGIARVTN